MRYRLNQVSVPLDYTLVNISEALTERTGCDREKISDIKILRRSLDSRHKPKYVLNVEFNCENPLNTNKIANLQTAENREDCPSPINHLKSVSRPVIAGAGPAGLFAAFTLIKNGYKPVILERGEPVLQRVKRVDEFWKSRKFSQESNVLFGEGGAGLFSDGKLTCRSKDRRRVRLFLETMVECGAPADILIDADAHIGSDRLVGIVSRLRDKIIYMGGEFQYDTKVRDIVIHGGVLHGVVVDDRVIKTDVCILATGHSARDVYKLLARRRVHLESKAFAVGVRVELPQDVINKKQYGKWADDPRLGAASFRLTRKGGGNNRPCYSFCMCPGGVVIACASSAGEITTNGMSYSARDGYNGNAAFLVPITREDMMGCEQKCDPVLAGCEFQRGIESKCFIAGGGNYSLPASSLRDFVEKKCSPDLPDLRSCRSAVPADVNELLPHTVSETLRRSIPQMLKVFDSVPAEDVVVYGAETRSSSPVRILRNDRCESAGVAGLFPCGEGSGYAGGIVSSAVDGIRIAESIISGGSSSK